MRFLYTVLFYAAIPAIVARMAWRGIREPAYRHRWRERFACYRTASSKRGVIWFHAVSVGESEAAFPLIRTMAGRFPEHPLLVTTTTPTGSARVRAVLGEIEHVYLPYDLPDGVLRFLDRYRPVLAVVMETEIWPNLYHACGKRNIPLAIVNARLSERSARRYAMLRAFARSTLANVSLVAARTGMDAERFLSIGARPESVKVTGNIKFDVELPDDYFQRGAALRESLFGSRKAWIAASTHEGEESEVLHAFRQVRATHPELLLVLVPRHPPRFDRVAGLCSGEGLKLSRRSAGESCGDADVFLVDTMGELRLFYAAADIAFVGGSLVPVGGHNVLEPALAGLPVIFGPHMFNFEEAGRLLVEAGGALQINNAGELAQLVDELLRDAERRSRIGGNGKAFVEAGRGALSRVEQALSVLIAPLQHNRSPDKANAQPR